MKAAIRVLLVLIFGIIIASCNINAPTEEATPDIANTSTSTQFPTNTPEPSPTTSATPTPTFTASPTASPTPQPDDTELVIAYTDGDAFLWTETDGITPLTQTGGVYDLQLSPDGQSLAYLHFIDPERSELRVVSIDGSADRLLVGLQSLDELVPHQEPVGIFSFEWLSQEDQIAFNTHIIGYGLRKSDDLHLVNVETSSITTLLQPGQGGEFYYSPDGDQIALVTSGDYMDLPGSISLVNAVGTDRHDNLITFPSVLTYSEAPFYPPLAWSPDSTYLLVAVPSPDPLAADASITIWRITADGSAAAELLTIDTSFFFSGLPHFSPDLTQLAFLESLGEPEDTRFNLHILQVDTSQEVIYHQGPLDYFSWIPGTHRFAFVSGDPVLILGEIDEPAQPTQLPWDFGLVWVNSYSYLSVEDSPEDQEILVYLNTLDGQRQPLFPINGRGPVMFDIHN